MQDVQIRPLSPGDSLDELTALLHRAYAPLAASGLRYVASHQPVETTRRRIDGNECYVAVRGGQVVGTATLTPPGRSPPAGDPPFYRRPDVAKLNQLAVEPELGGRGIGRRLLEHVEARARELGAAAIACDTAEGARELIAMYERRGYRFVEHADWRPHTNYRSVVLSLPLGEGPRSL